MKADAIVVGAACAAELAARGLSVFDAHGIGGGATAAGMGHIIVMNDSLAEFALSLASRAMWLEIAANLRARCVFALRLAVGRAGRRKTRRRPRDAWRSSSCR